jgi:hypothetical protein
MNQFPNYAGYPQNMHKFEERKKWRHIHSSTENEARAHTNIITTLEKRFFCRYRKDFGSKIYLFPCKNYSFWGLTTCAAHYHVYTQKKLFEFLKYNNICSLTAILNESISKLCELSAKYAQIWGTLKITPCNIRSSTEYEA